MLVAHVRALHAFYGEGQGLRVARKHIGWYVRDLPGGEDFRRRMNTIEDADAQVAAVSGYFGRLAATSERLPCPEAPGGAIEATERLAA